MEPIVERKQGPQSGADILVESLVRHGVEVVFAYPGGASMPIHQALTAYKDRIRTILPRHEQGGIFAAEGYARTTGKPGVVIATSGPGATNLVTGLADARMDSCPLIAITGQVPTHVIGTDAFQETPIVEIARAITKHHYLVQSAKDLTRVVREAFYIATTGRPGPVLVDVPKDIQQKLVTPDYAAAMDLPGYNPECYARPADLRRVADAIRTARRPLIYAGGGVVASGASELLREFAIRTNIPVTNTLMGLGSFPETHPLALQMLGMHGTVYANYAVNEADLLLAFGVRFDDRVTGKVSEFAKHGRIVHIDVDPSEINKNKTAFIPIQSDLAYALAELIKIVEPGDYREWHDRIAEWRRADPLTFEDREDAILPQYAIEELWRIVQDRGRLAETIITTGVGQHQMWAAQYYKVIEPRTWVTSAGLGAMGFGYPSALGAQAAHPDQLVIDIDGDGSFLMNIQELATARCENLPAKVFLINNQHLGMVVQWEDRFHAGNRAHTYLGPIDQPEYTGLGGAELSTIYPDFVKIAEGFGIPGRQVRAKAQLRSAIVAMIETPGPYVLDILVPYQEHVLPMIPSGKTVKDIIKH